MTFHRFSAPILYIYGCSGQVSVVVTVDIHCYVSQLAAQPLWFGDDGGGGSVFPYRCQRDWCTRVAPPSLLCLTTVKPKF